jgi:hypothetical protein
MSAPAGHPRTVFGSPLHLASSCSFQRVYARRVNEKLGGNLFESGLGRGFEEGESERG